MLDGRAEPRPAAPRPIRSWGRGSVVVKQGEYGACAVHATTDSSRFPATRSSRCVDPTGAGDSFAGGFFGYLDRARRRADGDDLVRRAQRVRVGDRIVQRSRRSAASACSA